MLYVITRKSEPLLDMPVYDRDGKDCVALFSTEPVAQHFMLGESNANELTVAEILSMDIPKLLNELEKQGIVEVAIDPRPRERSSTAPRVVALSMLLGMDADKIVDLLKGMEIDDQATNTLQNPSKSVVFCNECGREELVTPNETLPYCCDEVMRPAALNATAILASK